MSATLTLRETKTTRASNKDIAALAGLLTRFESNVLRAIRQRVYLSIVIPAYNEEERIAASLERVADYIGDRGYSSEVILVDDGSTDRTLEVGTSTLRGKVPFRILHNVENEGKGSAIRKGMLAAGGEYVLFMDADMSTPIEQLDQLLPHFLEGYDIVIGSRKIPGARIDLPQPKYREIMGKTFSYLSRILAVRSIHDFTCGFKCFRKWCISEIFTHQRLNGWGYDTEILFIAARKGFSIKEVPVIWSDSVDSKVRLWRDVLRSAFDLIKIRFNSLLGYYG